MTSFLSLDSVTVTYGAFTALPSFSLTVDDGEFFCLLGPSGSGKTTALGAIAGFTEIASGRVILGGRDITRLSPQHRQMGVVFQSYALFPHMTAEENIGYALKVRGDRREKIASRAAELLSLVRLDGKGHRFPRQMSGGEQQRVAIARALALSPRLMLLDEPLSNLDARLRDEMRAELRRIQRATGVTTILVTHDQEEAFGIADRIAVMNFGRLEQVGTPEDIYWSPSTRFVAGFIGQANVLEGRWTGERLETGGESFLARRVEAPEGPAALFLRPEELRIDGETRDNNLPGRIESIAALGSTQHIRVETPVGPLLVYRLAEPVRAIHKGEQVRISWDREAGRVMERAG